jgi:hypothetical protein
VLNGHLVTVPAGTIGFDCNQPVRPQNAQQLFEAGYRFAIRYVARVTPSKNDLTPTEANVILGAGLALMAVQHVESESSWVPSAAKGASYGQTASDCAQAIGFPPGSLIWLDLEGVANGVDTQIVIDYCNEWHRLVAGCGFLPGMYVGWHCGISAKDLYNELRFTHYWGAYNLNSDEAPIVRGIQMRQGLLRADERAALGGFDLDTDVVRADALGGLPVALTAGMTIA